MIIAIDYDDTYSINPEMWEVCIAAWRLWGHAVICVTCRQDTEENREEVVVPGVPRYFTGGSPKRWFLEQPPRGIRVDVWIDDNPDSIIRGM